MWPKGLDYRTAIGIFTFGGVVIFVVVFLYVDSRDRTITPIPVTIASPSVDATRTAGSGTPSTAVSPSLSPGSPTATVPVPGPKITSIEWAPAVLGWGDTVRIRIVYTTSNAAFTEVVLREAGQTTTGERVDWGPIKDRDGIDHGWNDANVLHAPWTAAPNGEGTFSLSLNCPFRTQFTSSLFITFVDAQGRSTPDDRPVVVVCKELPD